MSGAVVFSSESEGDVVRCSGTSSSRCAEEELVIATWKSTVVKSDQKCKSEIYTRTPYLFTRSVGPKATQEWLGLSDWMGGTKVLWPLEPPGAARTMDRRLG